MVKSPPKTLNQKLAEAACETAVNLVFGVSYGSEAKARKAFLNRKRFEDFPRSVREQIIDHTIIAARALQDFLSSCRNRFGFPYEYSVLESGGAIAELRTLFRLTGDNIVNIANQMFVDWTLRKFRMEWIDSSEDFKLCCNVHFSYLLTEYQMHSMTEEEIKALDSEAYRFHNEFAARYSNTMIRVDIEGVSYGYDVYVSIGPAGNCKHMRAPSMLLPDLDFSNRRAKSDTQHIILKRIAVELAAHMPRLIEIIAAKQRSH